MTDFKKLTYLAGLTSFLLLLGITALIFFGFVEKESLPLKKVSFQVKEKAKSLDIWRFSKGAKYKIVARNMIKKKNGVVLLKYAKVWIYQPKKPVVFIRANEAFVYPDHDVKASGNVYLNRKDLNIYTQQASWNNRDQIISGSEPFHGYTEKSKFKGHSFKYFNKYNKLVAWGVDIWLSRNH